jgi:hypothetical protein
MPLILPPNRPLVVPFFLTPIRGFRASVTMVHFGSVRGRRHAGSREQLIADAAAQGGRLGELGLEGEGGQHRSARRRSVGDGDVEGEGVAADVAGVLLSEVSPSVARQSSTVPVARHACQSSKSMPFS